MKVRALCQFPQVGCPNCGMPAVWMEENALLCCQACTQMFEADAKQPKDGVMIVWVYKGLMQHGSCGAMAMPVTNLKEFLKS